MTDRNRKQQNSRSNSRSNGNSEDDQDRRSSDMIGWLLVVAVVAGAGGTGGAALAGRNGSSLHHPAPISTVCTKYFKGGCK